MAQILSIQMKERERAKDRVRVCAVTAVNSRRQGRSRRKRWPRHRLDTKRMLESQKWDRPCQNVANFIGVLMVTHGSSGENQQTDTPSSSINPTRPLAVGDHTLN